VFDLFQFFLFGKGFKFGASRHKHTLHHLSTGAAYSWPIACAAAPAPTCLKHLVRPIESQRLLSLLPLWNFRAATLSPSSSSLFFPSLGRTEENAEANARADKRGVRGTRRDVFAGRVLQFTSTYKQGIWDIVCLYRYSGSAPDSEPIIFRLILHFRVQEFSDMEAIYNFLFPGQIFHELWYSPSNDWFEIDFCIFAFRARYGVQLEQGAFGRRTADFLWMMIFGAISLLVLSAIPLLESYYLGIPMVSMLLYVWSRENPNAQINIYGLVPLRSFYLPWVMLGLDVIFGSSILPGLMGIMVGHLYYFFAVLHPLATGKNYLKTPKWVYPYTITAKTFRSICIYLH
ncbi:hypothetical protein EJB05_33134, partial [Eragrostis curvula]